MNFPLLSLLIFVPLLAGLGLLLSGAKRLARPAALGVAAFLAMCGAGMTRAFEPSAGPQWIERIEWLPAIDFQYHLAADGISLVFVLLTLGVFVIALAASKGVPGADARYYGLALLLEAGLLGTFLAQNFLHFFLFWELALIPAFFLVKYYGGSARGPAATQFFLYTMLGSIGMLLAFLALFAATSSLDLAQLAQIRSSGGTPPSLSPRAFDLAIFLLAFIGVGVKAPIWPLHGWLPSTYAQAPTPVTMMLTGAMSKMGIYGLIRLILPIFPAELNALHQPLLILAVITILYGAWAALAQADMKRLFAYSSLSHLGYCFLGVFAAAKAGAAGLENERAAAVSGVILQALSHGVVAATLFGFISFFEQRSPGPPRLESFGGLRKINPRFAGLMGIAVFASLGLPGLSGFPAEFLIFKGAFPLAPVAAGCAVLGLLLTAAYLLTFFGKVFYGPLNTGKADHPDLRLGEKAIVLPGIAIAFLLGVAPQLALALFNPAVTALVKQLRF